MITLLCISSQSQSDQVFLNQVSGRPDIEIKLVKDLSSGISWGRKNKIDLILIPFELILSDSESFLLLSDWYREMRRLNDPPAIFLYFLIKADLNIIDVTSGFFSLSCSKNNGIQDIINLIRQATGKRKMERSLREEYENYSRIIGTIPLPCLEVHDGEIVWSNTAAVSLWNRSSEEIRGLRLETLLTLPEWEKLNGEGELPGKKILSGLYHDISGHEVPCRLIWYHEISYGKYGGLWYLEDRQEYAMLEASLRETRQECQEQLYLSETLMLRITPDGRITFANQAALTIFGYTENELLNQSVSILFPDPLHPDGVPPLKLFLQGENETAPATIRIIEQRRKDGQKVFVAWTVRAFYDSKSDLTGLICVGSDMTEVNGEGQGQISTRAWRDRVLDGTDIIPEVFDIILQVCMEISREGREGKPIGTSFLVGDRDGVLEKSRQLILNPFYGHSPELRNVISPDVREMLKEYALLDGAFVVSGDGMLEAAGRYITVDTSVVSLAKGMGTRHSSTAALTAVTRAVGFVVSESGGRISIIKNGEIIRMIG